MDLRVIKPVKAFLGAPDAQLWQGVSYWQKDGQAVVDYMTSVTALATTDAAVLAGQADAIMVSAYDGSKMVYAKAPPGGYVFLHHFAGTEVNVDIVPPKDLLLKSMKPPGIL